MRAILIPPILNNLLQIKTHSVIVVIIMMPKQNSIISIADIMIQRPVGLLMRMTF